MEALIVAQPSRLEYHNLVMRKPYSISVAPD